MHVTRQSAAWLQQAGLFLHLSEPCRSSTMTVGKRLLCHFMSIDPENFKNATHPLNFYEIWYACRTSFPDSKYTIFTKSAKLNRSYECLKTAAFCVH